MDYYTYGSALVQNWPDDAVKDIVAFMDWVSAGCPGDCPDNIRYVYDKAFSGDMDTLSCSGLENVEHRICGEPGEARYKGALLLYSTDMFQANEVCCVLEAVADKYGILPDRSALVGSSAYASACVPDDTLMPTWGGAVAVSCLGKSEYPNNIGNVVPAPMLQHCLDDWAEQALEGDRDKLALLMYHCEEYVVDAWVHGGDLCLMKDICDFFQDARITPELVNMDPVRLSRLKQVAALAVQHEEGARKGLMAARAEVMKLIGEIPDHAADQ